jgi:hypothetical protein
MTEHTFLLGIFMTLFKNLTYKIVFRSTAAGQIFFKILQVKINIIYYSKKL